MATQHADDLVETSVEFLRAVKTDDDATAEDLRRALAALDPDRLGRDLADDRAKTAFWTNLYNGFAQLLLRDDPDLWEHRTLIPVPKLFSKRLVTVAGHTMSLDDIEHGLLRRSKSAAGLGYLPRLRTGAFEQENRVAVPDPRIHFALNCGAGSCPPIAAYTAAGLDDGLDTATRSYLETECEYDSTARGVVRVPKLFSWYRGDFRGKAGTVDFLERYDVVPVGKRPKLVFKPYDWSMKLGMYADERS
ncbi:DUF547 domain-containing protein [Haloarchaeobius sp. DFWS5]|uniref:DUF547 domain-containing protein n=1 Tax=Haloarchaeobius sp. DFWS5 TaxID=3446114 RepID=UPI003EB85806